MLVAFYSHVLIELPMHSSSPVPLSMSCLSCYACTWFLAWTWLCILLPSRFGNCGRRCDCGDWNTHRIFANGKEYSWSSEISRGEVSYRYFPGTLTTLCSSPLLFWTESLGKIHVFPSCYFDCYPHCLWFGPILSNPVLLFSLWNRTRNMMLSRERRVCSTLWMLFFVTNSTRLFHCLGWKFPRWFTLLLLW